MTLGDWITWLTFLGGAYALGSLAWRRWGALIRHILSSYAGSEGGTQKARLPDTYQAEPPREPPRTTGSEPDANRFADIAYLAGRVEPDGAYTYSANKIAELVGGARAETLAAIREARGAPDPEPPAGAMLRVRDSSGERLVPR